MNDFELPVRAVFLDQDRLIAYRLSRLLVRCVEELLEDVPRGHAEQLDQVRRAALSAMLNTAEGAGEFRTKEKARFYRMARRSATESAAVLDSFVDRRVLTEADIEPARVVLHRLIGALTRLIQICDPKATPARSKNSSPASRATPPSLPTSSSTRKDRE
jgi:four helix bundle protein